MKTKPVVPSPLLLLARTITKITAPFWLSLGSNKPPGPADIEADLAKKGCDDASMIAGVMIIVAKNKVIDDGKGEAAKLIYLHSPEFAKFFMPYAQQQQQAPIPGVKRIIEP